MNDAILNYIPIPNCKCKTNSQSKNKFIIFSGKNFLLYNLFIFYVVMKKMMVYNWLANARKHRHIIIVICTNQKKKKVQLNVQFLSFFFSLKKIDSTNCQLNQKAKD